MKACAPWLALALTAACGLEEPRPSGRLGFDLLVDRAVSDKVASLQVAVLAHVKDCSVVGRDCLAAQVAPQKLELETLTDASGRGHKALTFPLALGDGGFQSFAVAGIRAGRDYAVVIEALTRDSPPNLYGSSCTILPEVTAGANKPLVATPVSRFSPTDGGTDAGATACDPRLEP